MPKVLLLALIIVIALVLVAVVWSYRAKSGTSMTFPDGGTVNPTCAPGSNIDILSALYGPASNSAVAVDVTKAVQNKGLPLVVSATNLGTPAVSGGGVLTLEYRCVGSSPKSATRAAFASRGGPFSSPPFISCDRSADDTYAVDATVRGATALLWAPYVQGAEFEQAPRTMHKPYRAPAPEDSLTHPIKLSEDEAERVTQQREQAEEREARQRDMRREIPRHRRERFEPVPDLPCHRPTKDAVEYSVDETLRGAPVPQALLYSTIAGDVPGLGVTNPNENESDNTVTHLWDYARVPRYADPYLTNSVAFGRSPYDIPKGDPGSMEEITDFLESFDPRPKQSLITALTGQSAPSRSMASRSRDITRFVDASEKTTDDGFGGSDSDLSSTRFNRAPIQTKRARGRR